MRNLLMNIEINDFTDLLRRISLIAKLQFRDELNV